MRKLLKILLPPFIGFLTYFLAVRYSGIYFTLKINEIGGGTISSFMAYYRYFLPLLFVVAVLTQALIVIPAWHKAYYYETWASKLADVAGLCFICALFATGISYMIIDSKHHFTHFMHVAIFMTGVQLAYWFINLLFLYLLQPKDRRAKTKAELAE
jgi:hypothetical protein